MSMTLFTTPQFVSTTCSSCLLHEACPFFVINSTAPHPSAAYTPRHPQPDAPDLRTRFSTYPQPLRLIPLIQ
jgi:hypothetical protein